MISRLSVLSIGVAICTLFSGCQSSNKETEAKSLRLCLPVEPAYADPRKITDTASAGIAKLFGEGLTRMNPKGELELALADSYEVSDDGTSYLFSIRDNVKWSNGTALTAYDIEYSWKTILDPQFLADYAYQLYIIKNGRLAKEGSVPLAQVGVRALDKNTLKVDLEYPAPYFLQMLSFWSFYPVSQNIDKANPNWAENAGKDFVSCGPFKLTEWKHNDQVVLLKNEHYWDAENVHIPRIHITILSDENTMLNLYERGEIDYLGLPYGELPVDSLPVWRAQGMLHQKTVATTIWYKINTTHPVLKNANVRRALSKAIDRSSIARNVTQGSYEPATGFLPHAMRLTDNTLIDIHSDPTAAREFLKKGLEEENISIKDFPTVKLIYRESDIDKRIAQAIQQQWNTTLGIKASLQNIEWKVYLNRVHRMDYEIARMQWRADFNDPINFLDIVKYADPHLSGNNSTGWEDEEYISLLNQSMVERNQEKRRALLAKAEEIFLRDMAIIPLFNDTYQWIQTDKLHNVTVSNLAHIDFKWAWLDDESK